MSIPLHIRMAGAPVGHRFNARRYGNCKTCGSETYRRTLVVPPKGYVKRAVPICNRCHNKPKE